MITTITELKSATIVKAIASIEYANFDYYQQSCWQDLEEGGEDINNFDFPSDEDDFYREYEPVSASDIAVIQNHDGLILRYAPENSLVAFWIE